MKPPSRICVCANGDPLAPRTWSGTAARICAELERRGRLGRTLDFDRVVAPIRLAAKAASKVYYTGSRYIGHGAIQHWLRSRSVSSVAHALEEQVILHMGTVAMPRRDQQSGKRHFVFVDSTWNLWTSLNTDRKTISPRLDRDAERMDRNAFHDAAHVFTTAEYVRENVIGHYDVAQNKVTVVGTGRGALSPDYSAKDYGHGVLLFVAKERFHDKGGHILLEAFRLARKRNPHLKLIIAGSDAHRRFIPEAEGVEVRGFISLEELQQLFHDAALFALPALNEPWGLVYLESLACRVPVLGLERNALPELTGNGRFGFYAANPSPEEVANTILKAFEKPALLAQMGQAGQEHCLRHFTWEQTVERMLEVIDRVEPPE